MTVSLKMQRRLIPFFFLLPGVLFFIVFQVYPLLQGLQMSFYNWSIMPGKQSIFVGLDNYVKAFNDPIFGTAVLNTIGYTLVTVPGQMVFAMAAAVLLNSIRRGRSFFRAVYYLPVITSWVIASLLIRYLFQTEGLINYFLVEVFHILSEPVAWLEQASTAFVAIDTLGIWKGIGWSMVIYLAALQGIPKELQEAAEIDGANRWNNFLYITLPLMRPTVVFTLVMLIIGGFNVFLSVFMITNGGPMRSTEVMLTYTYRQAFDFLEFGYGAALSMIMAVGLAVASGLQMKFLRRPTWE